ncbi:NADH-quinone oxidoreductase subunit C [Myroides ceti]|uniref:NADH-quinone oxidoreductase subunit C n=1 Tax=Paenimyroides ceti TaxID=395087 RepID=A0ABT8CVN3_9FLAO|nr:NADH-quinone oxidoreductase subunit C [Paenimyroides ceti]MDN3708500.1 NADH-quinone oxidoreductase subunit C [Paenimyroides ceti]
MSLTNENIQKALIGNFGMKVSEFHQSHDILTLEVQADALYEVIRFLKEDTAMNFNFLTDVCGVHYPDYEESRQFAVVYHLHNWFENVRIRIKTYLKASQPEVDSIVTLYPGANWQERETYDFYGIQFKGHPQLKRILNMDEMQSFPLRKEFPLEDQGRTDKDDRFFGRTGPNC